MAAMRDDSAETGKNAASRHERDKEKPSAESDDVEVKLWNCGTQG